MLASAMLLPDRSADRLKARKLSLPRGPAWTGAGDVSPQLDDLHRRYRQTLRALAEARARTERAERRLHSRIAELAWPAALGGIVAGFAAIVGLRLAGL